MNKVKSCIHLFLVMLCLFSFAAAESFGVVSGADTVNLRAQGSSSSEWLGSYTRGTWVTISGSMNHFYLVSLPDGKTGYMSMNYVQLLEPVPTHTCVVCNGTPGSYLNFRETPSYSSRVLGVFYDGVPLVVRSVADGWYNVEINDTVGYVRSEYVSDLGYTINGSSEVATVKSSGNAAVPLYGGPGLSYPVTGSFSGDTYVMVLLKGLDWCYVSAEGGQGFLSSRFLFDGLCAEKDGGALSPASMPTVTATPKPGSSAAFSETPYAIVSNLSSAQALALCQTPAENSPVLEYLTNGTCLTVVEQGTEWCRVISSLSGKTGYVPTGFLTLFHLPSMPVKTVTQPSGGYVDLYSSADMAAGSVICGIPSGRTVTILVPGEVWSKVAAENISGYILNTCLK